MVAANPGDTILLEAGYSNETATVTHNGMTVSGDATSTGIVLQLASSGIATIFLGGNAPINLLDAPDGNGITGNAGNNVITVKAGADSVNGGLGTDRLVVDYRLATGAVTGNSTSNFSEAGGGARTVTITSATFENFTVLTGSGADTLTVGDGRNVINAGNGANTLTAGNGVNKITGGRNADTITAGDGNNTITAGDGANNVTAGQGANVITGGANADTITAGDGGNYIDAGDGFNIITSGAGNDVIVSGIGADTIVAGGGNDAITIRGGADTVNSGAASDRLVVDYSHLTTAVTGGITGGNLLSGYSGHIADMNSLNQVDFVATESFTITTGSGNDVISTGDGNDILSGGAGNDALYGQGGDDTLIGGSVSPGGTNQLWGGAGNDTASYVGTSGTVYADLGAQGGYIGGVLVDQMNSIENLTGGSGANTLVGDGGANVLTGGTSSDVLYGQGGNDTLIGGAATSGSVNQLWGGNGSDTASYLGTIGKVYASIEDGGAYVDSGSGYVLTDAYNSIENITGGSGNDILIGNSGANVINGGTGADVLYGRGGADSFVFTAYADSNLLAGYDTIADFASGSDKLDLTALHTSAANITIVSGGGGTSLYVEQSAGVFNAATDIAIAFSGNNAINAGDILF
jgi:Ca2+-binding RTX toxin-like protein